VRIPRPTYANVVATLALFISLGGVSYAALTLPANSVGSRQLRGGAVVAGKLGFPFGIASDRTFNKGVGTGAPSCRGPIPCAIPPPPAMPLLSVDLNLRAPTHVLLLARVEIAPGEPANNPPSGEQNLTLTVTPESVGHRIETFEGTATGEAALDEADRFSTSVSLQDTIWTGAGRRRFTLTTSGYVSTALVATDAELVAIPLPEAS
jgi:hypothetical protein